MSEDRILKLKAQNLGPIKNLDAKLSKHKHNIIYARNGTGKSYLARALRCLEFHSSGDTDHNKCNDLLSSEAKKDNATGSFKISRGDTLLGLLELSPKQEVPTVHEDQETIFHVFSEDFVSEELRVRDFTPSGDIANEISIGSDNIEYLDAEKSYHVACEKLDLSKEELTKKFENVKTELKKRLGLKSDIKDYKNLEFDATLNLEYNERPYGKEKELNDYINKINNIKSFSEDDIIPNEIRLLDSKLLDIINIKNQMLRTTVPANISLNIKNEINKNIDFFKEGRHILHENSGDCPFCKQEIDLNKNEFVKSILIYLDDDETKHKKEINDIINIIINFEESINHIVQFYEKNYVYCNSISKKLNYYINLEKIDDKRDVVFSYLSELKEKLSEKLNDVSAAVGIDIEKYDAVIVGFNEILEIYNKQVKIIISKINSIESDRLNSQREACKLFCQYFIHDNWDAYQLYKKLKDETKLAFLNFESVKEKQLKESVRERVADTMSNMLSYFFNDKYKFNKDEFKINHKNEDESRKLDKILSDGEKTVIGFCYFIASIHKKISDDNDYKKLYLILDDPINSMSFEYINLIAGVLRNLHIDDKIGLSHGIIGKPGSSQTRIPFLIFTHDSYFFNICVINNIINSNATFSLALKNGNHEIQAMSDYVAPFRFQLDHVVAVVKGQEEPDHYTANYMRSVLEAVWRFCLPNKKNSQIFLAHCAEKIGVEVNSILNNTGSHGTFESFTPDLKELKNACERTLEIVRHFAPGQLPKDD